MKQIDLENIKPNEVYLYKDNKLQKIDKPKHGFGKTIIHWQDGKPKRLEINSTEEIK